MNQYLGMYLLAIPFSAAPFWEKRHIWFVSFKQKNKKESKTPPPKETKRKPKGDDPILGRT